MAEEPRKPRAAVVPDPEPDRSGQRDLGTTDRDANQDPEKDLAVRNAGVGTSRDAGRESAAGTPVENDLRAAEMETPGVKTRPAGKPIEKSE